MFNLTKIAFYIKFAFMKYLYISLFVFTSLYSQSKRDTLFVYNTEFRDFWDVKKYSIRLEPNFEEKSIKGSNRIFFDIVKDVSNPVFQIDIQEPMLVNDIVSDFEIISQKRDGNFLFIETNSEFRKGENHFLDISFEGNPMIAKNPPWDGGWIFTRDDSGKPWMTATTEEIGTSIWLPMKDYWGDEPDEGINFMLVTPREQNLIGIANGRLMGRWIENEKHISAWKVKNPINGYSITPYFGNYVRFSDNFEGERGNLPLEYYVIEENLDKAKKQFLQVKPMLEAFEYWFGPYPFYDDGYKIVETPHLGMEHQSAIAYGNGFKNGYMGRDRSYSGVGMKFDFILIHESGHEWFANSITAKNIADMWIHESFTTYSETLFIEYNFGKEDANAYVIGQRKNISNDKPIIPIFGVRSHGSGDMYEKGANMLHTIRQVINNDEKFRQILRGLNEEFYHKIVTGKQIQDYINEKSDIDFTSVYKQYLTTINIPKLEYYQKGRKLFFKWVDVVDDFYLPIRIKDTEFTIIPSNEWQSIRLKNRKTVKWDENYYVKYICVDEL